MPRFFFDYRDEQGRLDRDDDGLAFPSWDAAYQDALRAVAEMREDACCEGQNCRAEIRDTRRMWTTADGSSF